MIQSHYYLLGEHIHADGTYKLVWQQHTLIVGGTTDKSKQFHPFGVMLTKRERQADYEFFFNTIKKAFLIIEEQNLQA